MTEEKKWEGKECSICHEFKPLFDYYKNTIYQDGYEKMCKTCKKEYNHKHYLEHKEYWANWYQTKGKQKKHCERVRIATRKYQRKEKAKLNYLFKTMGSKRQNVKKFFDDLPED